MAEVLKIPTDKMISVWGDSVNSRNEGRDGSFAKYIEYLCDVLGVRHPAHIIGKSFSLRADLNSKWMTPRKDTLETLQRIKDADYKLGLISDTSYDVPVLWEENSLRSYFDSAIFSCDVNLKKPDQKIYQLTCHALNVQAEDCLYVGDGGSMELTGSEKFGMKTIRISVPGEIKSELHCLEIDYWEGRTIAALSEIIDILSEN